MHNNKEPLRGVSPMGAPRGPIIFPKLVGAHLSWFALYVQVNHEKEVARRLSQKSIESYLPFMDGWSRRKDRRKPVQVPLFPGYVFFRTVLDNYTNVLVLKTPGIVSILRNSEGPLSIPSYQIEILRTMLSSSEPVGLHPYLKDGDWVIVLRGPLAGCSGVLVRQSPKRGRLVVSVDIIHQAVSVELNMDDVEPVNMPGSRIAC